MVWPCLKIFYLAKTILQGKEKEEKVNRRRGGWEDNIKEWTGMDIASSIRAAEDRTRWNRIVVKLSVVLIIIIGTKCRSRSSSSFQEQST